MNCKPGEMAIVIGARFDKNVIGCIVEIHEHVPYGVLSYGRRSTELDVWHVSCGNRHWLHSDSRLRPIRDNHGQDETLRWAPVPVKEKA